MLGCRLGILKMVMKNQVRVALTERGRQMYRETNIRESIQKVMAALSDQEQVQLIQLLKKISLLAFTEMGVEANDIEYYHSMRGLLK